MRNLIVLLFVVAVASFALGATIAPTTTTKKPTTKAPTTTAKPTTKAPTTTTKKPTTKAPTTTAKPTTKAPTTTAKPTTKAPTTTARPTTKAPTTTAKPATNTTKPSCPSMCPMIYSPVCYRNETDGSSFSFPNQCMANYAICMGPDKFVFLFDGECAASARAPISTGRRDCSLDSGCDTLSGPVCLLDSHNDIVMTFGNDCYARKAICLYENRYKNVAC